MTRTRCYYFPHVATRNVGGYELCEYNYAKVDASRAEWAALTVLELTPEEAKRILYEDLARHREQLADINTEETRHEDIASGPRNMPGLRGVCMCVRGPTE